MPNFSPNLRTKYARFSLDLEISTPDSPSRFFFFFLFFFYRSARGLFSEGFFTSFERSFREPDVIFLQVEGFEEFAYPLPFGSPED